MLEHEALKGKTAVITGGSGGLCSSFAYAMAEQKMNVAVLGRTKSKLDAVVEKINALGGRGFAAACDVTDRESVINAKKAINAELGRVDILINGAGGNHPNGNTTKEIFEVGDIENSEITSFFDLADESFKYVFDINLVGTLVPTQVFMPDMIGNSVASVINISSMSAYHPLTKVSAYSAAKAAVSNLTEWLACHFGASGVRVNAIAPGFFLTAQNKQLLTNSDGSLTDRAQRVIAHTPMKRFGNPEELNGTMLWLADATQSEFVTGVTIPVDGGFNACSGV